MITKRTILALLTAIAMVSIFFNTTVAFSIMALSIFIIFWGDDFLDLFKRTKQSAKLGSEMK